MAELSGLPTPTIDWHAADPSTAFANFKTLCELYFEGPLSAMSEARKIRYLLIWTGQEGRDIVKSWELSDEEKDSLQTHWDKFESYVKPHSNFRVARYKLRNMRQEPNEPVDAFVKRIKLVCADCKFTNPNENALDTLIYGLTSRRVQSKLLETDENTTLAAAVKIAQQYEATARQLDDIHGAAPSGVQTVHAVHTASKSYASTQRKPATRKQHTRPSNAPPPACGNCGRAHTKEDKCPARGTVCKGCGKANHWMKMCRSTDKSRGARPKQKPQQRIHTLVEAGSAAAHADDEDAIYFHTLNKQTARCENTARNRSDTQAFVTLKATSDYVTRDIKCKIDTGAEGNVIPASIYRSLVPVATTNSDEAPPGLQPTQTRLIAFGGYDVEHFGTCSLTLTHGEQSERCTFHVSKADGPVILGLPSCRALQLVTLHYNMNVVENTAPENQQSTAQSTLTGDPDARKSVLSEYADCFDGIGCFRKPHHITIDPAVPPVIHPPRRVPVSLRSQLKAELDNLVSQDIITKVDRPTDWVNSIVCVTKANGSLRLCLDPKDLNSAIKRPHHYTPTLQDILPKLAGAKWFSILDATKAYHTVPLDEESSYLTTFNTVFGRYRYKRMCFGLKDAQDVFQRQIDATFGDIEGVIGIADDLIIYGFDDDRKDHDATLHAVLNRARQTGVKFNREKMVISARKIPFFGHILGADGLQPDPAKVSAINAMTSPTDVKQLQTFLGMAMYLSQFTPRLATVSAPPARSM